MTNEELESAFVALTQRVKNLERLMANCVSVAQQNGVILLLQQDIDNLTTGLSSAEARIETLESDVAAIV